MYQDYCSRWRKWYAIIVEVPKSCSGEYIFGLIMDLYIRFRAVVDWYKSLCQSCNGKYGLTLQNPAMKWFLNVCIYFSAVLYQCIFGGANLNQCFYLEDFELGCWKLHYHVFESVILSLWLRSCCKIFHTHLGLIVLHDFFITSVRMVLLLYLYITTIYLLPLKYFIGNLSVRSEYIFPINSMTPAIISFVLSWMVINFSSNRVT